MVATVNNFWGAETGGLEELTSETNMAVGASGSGRGGAGTRAYEVTSYSPARQFTVSPFESIADAGNGYIFGFSYYGTDGTPPSEFAFFDILGGATSILRISILNQAIKIYGSLGSLLGTSSNCLLDAAWNDIEVYFYRGSSTGEVKVFHNNVEVLSLTSQALPTSPAFDTISFNPDGVLGGPLGGKLDDMYIMSGCGASGSASRLGPVDVFWYRSNAATSAGDYGDALETGTWQDMQTLPFSSASSGGYTSTAALTGAVLTNDLAPGAVGGGPNGHVTGTVVKSKGIWNAYRSGGSGAGHFAVMGRSGLSPISQAISLTTSAANYIWVMSNTSYTPTASTYGQIGIGKSSGGQDIICNDMLFTILHQRPASGATLSASPASVAVTGQNALFKRDLRMGASPASVAISGPNIGLSKTVTMPATSASLAISGGNIATTVNRKLLASAAAVALSGGNTSLNRQLRLQANSASMVITGGDANLPKSKTMNALAAAMTIGGGNAALLVNRFLSAGQQSMAITGGDVTFSITGTTITMPADPASISIGAGTVAFKYNRVFAADPASISITGPNVALNWAKHYDALPASVSISGGNAAFLRQLGMPASPAALVVSGGLTDVLHTAQFPAVPLAISINGGTVEFKKGYRVGLDPASVTIDGGNANLNHGKYLVANAAVVSITGGGADFTHNVPVFRRIMIIS